MKLIIDIAELLTDLTRENPSHKILSTDSGSTESALNGLDGLTFPLLVYRQRRLPSFLSVWNPNLPVVPGLPSQQKKRLLLRLKQFRNWDHKRFVVPLTCDRHRPYGKQKKERKRERERECDRWNLSDEVNQIESFWCRLHACPFLTLFLCSFFYLAVLVLLYSAI